MPPARVWTAEQRQNGLGWECPAGAVYAFLSSQDWMLVAEFPHVASSQDDGRRAFQFLLKLENDRRARSGRLTVKTTPANQGGHAPPALSSASNAKTAPRSRLSSSATSSGVTVKGGDTISHSPHRPPPVRRE